MRVEDLVEAVDNSDVARITSVREGIRAYPDPWELHLALYPAAQRVLNPPFINPHLPKMYHICRDFFPCLPREGQGALVSLEALEFARRTKLEEGGPAAFAPVAGGIRRYREGNRPQGSGRGRAPPLRIPRAGGLEQTPPAPPPARQRLSR